MTIGEAGVNNTDLSYTGDAGESAFSIQYYRNKAVEFQEVLISLDRVARSAQNIIDLTYDSYDAGSSSGGIATELMEKLSQFESRKFVLKSTAETINMGASLINSFGGRMPQLSMPQGLGLGPLIPATTIAAFAAAAGLIIWGLSWITDTTSIVQRYILTSGISDPAIKDKILAELAVMDTAQRATMESPIASLAGGVKWLVIAGVAYLAYKAYAQSRG